NTVKFLSLLKSSSLFRYTPVFPPVDFTTSSTVTFWSIFLAASAGVSGAPSCARTTPAARTSANAAANSRRIGELRRVTKGSVRRSPERERRGRWPGHHRTEKTGSPTPSLTLRAPTEDHGRSAGRPPGDESSR